MKLRNPSLIRACGFGAARLLRLWLGTLRFRYRPLGPDLDPTSPACRGRFIYAFWHEYLLLPAQFFARTNAHVLISQHADGQLIAEACRHMGIRVVRGSTTRGGAGALLRMLEIAQKSHLAITPDGPRGPRRRVQPGLVYLAARTGLPVVAAGFACRRPWRMRSWDRFALPRPWSLGTGVTTEPIHVPADVPRSEFEVYRQKIEQSLLEVTEAAERLAEAG